MFRFFFRSKFFLSKIEEREVKKFTKRDLFMRWRTLFSMVLAGGVIAHVTKPETSSFAPFFRGWLKKFLARDAKTTSMPQFLHFLNEGASFMASAITSSLSNVRYIETPVYVVAFIQLPGASEEIAFLGAFNTWFSLGRLVVE